MSKTYGLNHLEVVEANSKEQQTQFRSRWEAIRAANVRNVGQHSTWDAIRQQHERTKLSGASSTNDSAMNGGNEDPTIAQARFEAMLAAERRRSQG